MGFTSNIKQLRSNSGNNLAARKTSVTRRAKEVQSAIEGEFCDVKIRDKSEFLLEGWSSEEEREFLGQKAVFKSNLRINQVPVLFQFVKKYTKTVKARENIYRKF